MDILRKSRSLKLLRSNSVVRAFKLNLSDGRAAEIAALSGFDCLWLDMEHIGSDWSTIERQIWAAKSHNVDVMVRVPRGSYSDFIRPLELDAAGIMVPHVMNLEDAMQIVRMTRFHPIGRRSVDGGNSDGAYCISTMTDYIQHANTERFICIQIEDPEPLEELDEIAALEGIDMLFFGPGDFSHSIGLAGQTDHAYVEEARRLVAQAARAHGKYAGTVGNEGNLASLIEMGYQFISVGADVVGLGQYCQKMISVFDRTLQRPIETPVEGSMRVYS